MPETVYVYIPAGSTAGLNMFVPLINRGDHVPPASGVPNNVVKSKEGSEIQIVDVPFVPASGDTFIRTSKETSSKQFGVVPVSSYA